MYNKMAPRRSHYTDEDILDDVRQYVQENPDSVSVHEFNSDPRFCSMTPIRDRFGSWSNVLAEIGFEQVHKDFTNEELLDQLREFANSSDTLSSKEFARRDEYCSPWTIKNRFGSWSAGLREAGVSDSGMECPVCGGFYSSLGHHWQMTCEFPDLSPEQRDIITGLLMSDGCVSKRGELVLGMVNKEFLEWVSQKLAPISRDVRQSESAKRKIDRMVEVGFSSRAELNPEEHSQVYTLRTRVHPFTKELRGWYSSGQKRIDTSVELTPTMLKMWYVGDGHLNTGNKSPRASIANTIEQDRRDELQNMFEGTPFDPDYIGKRIQFDTEETKELLEWMGSPPPGFEHKWGDV